MVDLGASETDVDGSQELEEEPVYRSAKYVAHSLRVWGEEVARLGDHKLVTCILEVEVGDPEAIAANPVSELVKEPVLGWRRRDGGDRKFWAGLEAAGNIHMDSWLDKQHNGEFKENYQGRYGDHLLATYKQHLDQALLAGVGRRRKRRKGKSKILVWSQEIFERMCTEKKAHSAWMEDEGNKERAQEFRQAKSARKYVRGNTP